MTDPPAAARRWGDALAAWSLPEEIVDRALESPWEHDVAAFVVDESIDRSTTSNRWARELLPPTGATVLDVGCGGGRSSLPLVPPATELIGVDRRGAMLDEFVHAASAVGAARRTVHGAWPDVADATPVADVVVCHHVLYDVDDVVPFVEALTRHARLGVVVEVPVRHPMSAWSPAWTHFWGIERPDSPTSVDLIEVLREFGLDPEVAVGPRRPLSAVAADPERLVPVARRRLCLDPGRDEELAAWLAANPPEWVADVATIRWAGDAPSG